jgi:hypothetical protein
MGGESMVTRQKSDVLERFTWIAKDIYYLQAYYEYKDPYILGIIISKIKTVLPIPVAYMYCPGAYFSPGAAYRAYLI